MEEEFRIVKDYEKYGISNLGRVKNLSNGKIKKASIDKSAGGYYRIGLYKNGKESKKRIHVLIAQAFIPNPENKSMVDHIDKVRSNNDISNLRWVTRSQNGMNSSLSSDNKSGCIGISYREDRDKWTAFLNKEGKSFKKQFNTKEEAFEYRVELEKLHFGVYASNYKPPTIIINITINN